MLKGVIKFFITYIFLKQITNLLTALHCVLNDLVKYAKQPKFFLGCFCLTTKASLSGELRWAYK